MLKLENITKIYKMEEFEQKALDKVSIDFRENEFVSILGPSGSGKTTLLNIIGGLDNYTSGDLIINGVSTKKYNDRDWDTYRNHRIGFVFQSYNLIPHQSILSNVELALTLSGVSKTERRKRAKDALKKVGLSEHINKKPNQLSGGQMQRVAIARALVNNPDILLADEPTGALDSETSKQIMNLLKEVAKDKLVIMVTHNAELAEAYSTRIIELKDGHILGDTDSYQEKKIEEIKSTQKDKNTSMSFLTALSLSLNNLMTKKGRTILTSFAGSIGIIGIALILSLSSGFQDYISRVQEEALTSYPLTIEESSIDLTSAISERRQEVLDEKSNENVEENHKIYSNDTIADTLSLMSSKIQSNNLELFKKYIEDEENGIKEYTTAISYEYHLDLQLYKSDTSEGIVQVNPNTVLESIGINFQGMNMSMMMNDVWNEMFENEEINNKMYDVISGRMPQKYNEVVLLVNEDNEISDYVLYALGLKDQNELEEMYEKVSNGETIETEKVSYSYDELVGLSYKLLLNTDYYEKQNNIWIDKREDEEYLKEKLQNAEEIKIVGIIKPSEEATVSNNSLGGIMYTNDLEKYVINKINESDIVKEQKENPNVNVITGLEFNNEEFHIEDLSMEQKMYLQSLPAEELADIITKYKEQSESTYDTVLLELGSVDLEKPSAIYVYAKDFKSKEEIKNIIANYNQKQMDDGNESNVINYNDLVGMLMSSITNIIDMISYVLIAFVSISLVVSSIMIGIITYISVLERTKEIGILRAIGASKKDVSRVFNAETLIVGLIAGIIGIGITILLNIPINIILKNIAGVSNLSKLPVIGALILVIISVVLTMIAGLIPSRMASKKDPVESLRSE
ncbi:MAG: ABC transporter ATP-binding protein/permease [Clostridia bacterium]|nr:ABC transporter ATP-binding protein/permease [Clostridia bacterium]